MRKILTFAAAILACAALANASLIPTLSTKTPKGSNFAFTYSDAGTTAQLTLRWPFRKLHPAFPNLNRGY